jgi:hypothetical protein
MVRIGIKSANTVPRFFASLSFGPMTANGIAQILLPRYGRLRNLGADPPCGTFCKRRRPVDLYNVVLTEAFCACTLERWLAPGMLRFCYHVGR